MPSMQRPKVQNSFHTLMLVGVQEVVLSANQHQLLIKANMLILLVRLTNKSIDDNFNFSNRFT